MTELTVTTNPCGGLSQEVITIMKSKLASDIIVDPPYFTDEDCGEDFLQFTRGVACGKNIFSAPNELLTDRLEHMRGLDDLIIDECKGNFDKVLKGKHTYPHWHTQKK